MNFVEKDGVNMPMHVEEEEDEIYDPFAQYAVDHPALGSTVNISPDIYKPLFDSFFESEIFERWLNRKNSWQLHCVGGPGAGKTTYAAITLERVCKRYAKSIGATTHVASIFIREAPIDNELAFVEDCLKYIYVQLSPVELVTGLASTKSFERYARACDTGTRASTRIELVARALQQRVVEVVQTGCAFLIVDNLDRCSPTLVELLQREFSVLQNNGLGIMMTSRLPKHEKMEDAWCDFHERGPYDEPLQFFWRCGNCEKHYMCERETCFDPERICNKCGADTFWIQPAHMTMSIEGIYGKHMKAFIAWDLEREHGDLGLGSSACKPPLSSFGVAFRRAKSGEAGQDWVQDVFEIANGSVVQAKLALDRIHNAPSPDAIDFSPSRMPANVQALFNIALKDIERRPLGQRELALKIIAAVGKVGDEDTGIPLSRLAGLLKGRPHTTTSTRVPPRSAEDIVNATNGYLRLDAPRDGQTEYNVVAFNRLFFQFANEDYNDELVMANSLLRTSNIPRSFTRGPEKPSNDTATPELSWQDLLGDLKRFESPKLVASPTRKPPLVRRESSGLRRSQTLISSGASRATPPPAGLGLRF